MVGIPFGFHGVLGFNTIATASYNIEHIIIPDLLSVFVWSIYVTFSEGYFKFWVKYSYHSYMGKLSLAQNHMTRNLSLCVQAHNVNNALKGKVALDPTLKYAGDSFFFFFICKMRGLD